MYYRPMRPIIIDLWFLFVFALQNVPRSRYNKTYYQIPVPHFTPDQNICKITSPDLISVRSGPGPGVLGFQGATQGSTTYMLVTK